MVSWGLMDNPLAIILPGLISVFGVFLMRQFFKTMPRSCWMRRAWMAPGNCASFCK